MMGTQQALARIDWTSLSGVILEGGYELQELLEAEPVRASFKTRILGDRFTDAVCRFFISGKSAAEKQIGIWQGIRAVRHPNVVAPLGSGSRQVDAVDLVYVVLARGDEALSAVLEERALTVAETGEVLISLVNALKHLHSYGLVHGCVSPREVLAVGELIKVQSDSLRYAGDRPSVTVVEPKYLAPESKGENLTAAADVWCLGATILETMTRQAPSDESRDAAVKLDLRLGHMIGRCLEADPAKRCSLEEALGIYKGEVKVRPMPVPVSKPAPSVVPPANGTAASGPNAAPSAVTPPPAQVPTPAPVASASAVPEPASGATAAAVSQPVPKKPATAISEAATGSLAAAAGTGSAPKSVPAITTTQPKALAPASPAPAKPETTGPRVMRPATPVQTGPRPARPREPMPTKPSSGANSPSGPATRQDTPRVSPTLVSAQSFQTGGVRREEEDSRLPLLSPRLYIALAAIVVLVLVFWLARPKRTSVAQGPVRNAETTSQRTSPSVPPSAAAQRHAAGSKATSVNRGETAPTQAVAATPAPVSPAPTAASSTDGRADGNLRPVWRVILYTYSKQTDAQHRADALKTQHPQLNYDVFAPKGDNGPYLVIAGVAASRDEAQQLRRKAVGLGMPRDSYVQNYKQ